MDNKTFTTTKKKKDNYFKKQTTEDLEKELKVLLCMDNKGGMLANDILEELGKRFTELKNICQNINKNSKRIINNLQQESIDVYNFIQSEYKKGAILKNNIFQFTFRSFYRLDSAGLTPQFKDKYFELFEENIKNTNPNMTETLLKLNKIKNFKDQYTVQFSFVTKMFHTIDNKKPIYDNEVITVFGFKQPYSISDTLKKINEYNRQYEKICSSYFIIERDKLLSNTIDKFHNNFSGHELNDTMVIDFIFWSAGKLIRQDKKINNQTGSVKKVKIN